QSFRDRHDQTVDLRLAVQRRAARTSGDEHALPAIHRRPAHRAIVDGRAITRDDGVTLIAFGAGDGFTLRDRITLQLAQQEFARRLLVGLAVDRDPHQCITIRREGRDGVAPVLDSPAFREGHGDSHVGVIETVVTDDALRLARPVGDAVDGGQVFVVTHQPATRRRVLDVRGTLGRLHRAFVRTRVTRKYAVIQARLAALGLGALPFEF